MVGMVGWMHSVRSSRPVDGDESAVDKSNLNGEGRVEASLLSQLLLVYACVVVHVQVHADKFLLQAFQDVDVPPNLLVPDAARPQVELEDHLVDPFEIGEGESSEAWPFCALHIDLHHHVAASEVSLPQHVEERVVSHVIGLFGGGGETGAFEPVEVVVGGAGGGVGVGAVVLVVGDQEL